MTGGVAVACAGIALAADAPSYSLVLALVTVSGLGIALPGAEVRSRGTRREEARWETA